MAPSKTCSVKGCGKRAAGYCDACDAPRCQDHGNGSLFEQNGQSDFWGCYHPDATAWTDTPCDLLATTVVV